MMERGHQHRHGRQGRGQPPPPGLFRLSSCAEGETRVIAVNPHLQLIEMGFFIGARVHVLRNDPGDRNLVLAVGPARYAIARRTVRDILVR
jgi:Fe2+ transport system protein FeoA